MMGQPARGPVRVTEVWVAIRASVGGPAHDRPHQSPGGDREIAFSGCGDSEVMNFVFHSCVGGTCAAEILPVRALSLFLLRRPGWQLSLR